MGTLRHLDGSRPGGQPRLRARQDRLTVFTRAIVHLVLGPAANGKPVRFRVTIDGQAPGANHGVDTDAQGDGKITDHRLYQLIRQKDAIEDRTFEIEFLDPGAQAYAFTFG